MVSAPGRDHISQGGKRREEGGGKDIPAAAVSRGNLQRCQSHGATLYFSKPAPGTDTTKHQMHPAIKVLPLLEEEEPGSCGRGTQCTPALPAYTARVTNANSLSTPTHSHALQPHRWEHAPTHSHTHTHTHTHTTHTHWQLEPIAPVQ